MTIAIGSSDYQPAAARRLSEILLPWGVGCRVVKAADINRPRPLSEREAATWVGLEFGRAQPGVGNSPAKAGFDVDGPVILLGSADDNPVIAFIQEQRFLPYRPDAMRLPGRGRGMLAWQRDAIGPGKESITVIAYDSPGLSEAVGTLYEAAAGIEPITRFTPPHTNAVKSALTADTIAAPKEAWHVVLPDRAVAMKTADDGSLEVLTWDGTLARIDPSGRILTRTSVTPAAMADAAARLKVPDDRDAIKLAEKHPLPGRILKTVARRGSLVAAAYWGGTLRVVASSSGVLRCQLLPQDITGVAWLNDVLVAGLADGKLVALDVR